VDWFKPVRPVGGGAGHIRALWDSNGELVNRDSTYFPLRNALFDLPPYKGKGPSLDRRPAHGPRCCGRPDERGRILPAFAHKASRSTRGRWNVSNGGIDAGREPMRVSGGGAECAIAESPLVLGPM